MDWNKISTDILRHSKLRSLRGSVDWNFKTYYIGELYGVAPFAGAWIEIFACIITHWNNKSLPSRERGLKYLTKKAVIDYKTSLPSRERGLKLQMSNLLPAYLRRSLRGSVDWNDWSNQRPRLWQVAPFAGAWIEIGNGYYLFNRGNGRSLRGSVDWNWKSTESTWTGLSLPSRERGLKFSKLLMRHNQQPSLPSRERGLKCLIV